MVLHEVFLNAAAGIAVFLFGVLAKHFADSVRLRRQLSELKAMIQLHTTAQEIHPTRSQVQGVEDRVDQIEEREVHTGEIQERLLQALGRLEGICETILSSVKR